MLTMMMTVMITLTIRVRRTSLESLASPALVGNVLEERPDVGASTGLGCRALGLGLRFFRLGFGAKGGLGLRVCCLGFGA